MDEDTFHKATSGTDRWVLCFDTSEKNVQKLWGAREQLEEKLQEHWSAVKMDVAPKVMQITQKTNASAEQLAKMFNDALNCGVFVVYGGNRVVTLLDHSVVSGHLGCRITSWMSGMEWVDHIGMPQPSLMTELAAMALGAFRVWRVPIVRAFWGGAGPDAMKPIPAPKSVSAAATPSTYACHFHVAPGTHPQAVMHQVLTRVTAGWRSGGRDSWIVCSAAPFKEIRGIANNVGVMSYTFPIEPACSATSFRKQLGLNKWQVVCSAAANRAFAGKAGQTVGGAIVSRLMPDMEVGRGMLDALFSFMVMKLDATDALHLYCTNDHYGGPSANCADYPRQKCFLAAAYDKDSGKVHVTLHANLKAEALPDQKLLRGAGFEPFEKFGPFDRARLTRNDN